MRHHLPINHILYIFLIQTVPFFHKESGDSTRDWLPKRLQHQDRFKVNILKFPKRQILESPKLKEFADDNFKVDEKWQKIFQMERKHCEKGAISPLPSVFCTHLDNLMLFSSNLLLSSADSFSLEECKI